MSGQTKTRTFLAKAEITRDYGKHKITFGLAEQVECGSTGEVKEALLNLQSLLENQITVYEAVSLPYVKLPNAGLPEQTGVSSGDAFTLESILIESVGGKKRVRAIGGKYTKHGVPVYPECGTDLDLFTLDYGSHDFRNLKLTVKVELDGDKPRRALSIR